MLKIEVFVWLDWLGCKLYFTTVKLGDVTEKTSR